MTIRLMLADDQALFREGLEVLLSVKKDIEIVAQAADGAEAVRQALATRPDVILMDVRMPVMDGVAATREIKAALPQTHILVLTTFAEDEIIFDALRAGAIGYLLKDTGSEDLVGAIRTAARGESQLAPAVATRLVSEFARMGRGTPQTANDRMPDPLTERELEILQILCQGLSNQAIADRLFISEGTVKNHITHIYAKLDVSDRTQAVLRAREWGLVS